MTSPAGVRPERVSAAEVRPLRLAVLRPGQPAERVEYPGDDLATTVHLGVRDLVDGLVAVASLYAEPVSERAGTLAGRPGIRIRGMAAHPLHRGLGYGLALVERGVSESVADTGEVVWCNARTTAAGYYQRLGFSAASAVFELPHIGPHAVMIRAADA